MKPNVVVIANKWWEAVVLISVLEHARENKPEFSACPRPFTIHSRRSPQESSPEPRFCCRINDIDVEVLCIEELIKRSRDSSSSYEKQAVLKTIAFQGAFDASLIIAFGTAASPEANRAGNVVIGSSVFVFNASEQMNWVEAEGLGSSIGKVVVSSVGASMLKQPSIFNCLEEAQNRFLTPPNSPSPTPKIIFGNEFVSVGVINVLRSKDYHRFDPIAIRYFESVKNEGDETQSIETTHGLIRLCVDRPFLYVSGIANQLGQFEQQVQPNKYSQNFSASHNAAISIAWMLPTICDFYATNPKS